MSEFPARIIATAGTRCTLDLDGAQRTLNQRRNRAWVLCGDRVAVADGVIAAIAPRHGVFCRADRFGEKQPIAANVDLALIVVAAEPAPTRDLIARYLIACADCAIEPLIVINKADLFIDADAEALWREAALHALAVTSETVSTVTGAGLEPLRRRISGRVAMLIGMSGVGKSSLLMALKPGLDLRTQSVSSAHGKGRHTTSVTTWYPLDDGALIDSPGVWEFGLWPVAIATVLGAFPDVAQHAQHCKFGDCTHQHEPGCAVRAAVEAHTLSPDRLEAYLRIVRTLPATARRDRLKRD
jgi:ribosome biogenesis GTPase / thiamine phosphate phosphatase